LYFFTSQWIRKNTSYFTCTYYFYKDLYSFVQCPWAYCNWFCLYILHIHFKNIFNVKAEISYLMVYSFCMHSCSCIMVWRLTMIEAATSCQIIKIRQALSYVWLKTTLYIWIVLFTCGLILVNNQLDAQFFFLICLFQFSTCFEQPPSSSPGESIVSIQHLVYVTV